MGLWRSHGYIFLMIYVADMKSTVVREGDVGEESLVIANPILIIKSAEFLLVELEHHQYNQAVSRNVAVDGDHVPDISWIHVTGLDSTIFGCRWIPRHLTSTLCSPNLQPRRFIQALPITFPPPTCSPVRYLYFETHNLETYPHPSSPTTTQLDNPEQGTRISLAHGSET